MFSKISAKDLMVYIGCLILGYLATDFIGGLKNQTSFNTKSQIERQIQDQKERSAQDMSLIVTLKDIEIKLTRTEDVVNQIKINTDKDMKQIKEELIVTRESLKSELSRANIKIYDLRKEFSQMNNEVSVLKSKVNILERK